jgi:8-oxo-dGTP diphosphatase
VLFRARAVGGMPRGDQHETDTAAWVPVVDLPALPIEPPVRLWISHALSVGELIHLG